jgi:hypothetical protein
VIRILVRPADLGLAGFAGCFGSFQLASIWSRRNTHPGLASHRIQKLRAARYGFRQFLVSRLLLRDKSAQLKRIEHELGVCVRIFSKSPMAIGMKLTPTKHHSCRERSRSAASQCTVRVLRFM